MEKMHECNALSHTILSRGICRGSWDTHAHAAGVVEQVEWSRLGTEFRLLPRHSSAPRARGILRKSHPLQTIYSPS